MANNEISMIMAQLMRLEAKMDTMSTALNRVNERLSKLETQMAGQEEVNKRVDELWSLRNRGMGVKESVAWLIPTLMAVASLYNSFH
ncbi:MAG: hypothetical protein J6O13_11330 [Selenomonas sp.]|nr:hypothetical protein [Selenomonas sp.]